ncbi:MAG: prolyl oligopeptidase family serine peptidase [Chloroflexi bacterium]|nr:prolyl oligopeptidase family serine peptidase [Chloroflexota bacterium]
MLSLLPLAAVSCSLLARAAPSPLPSPAELQPGDHDQTLTFGGRTRTYIMRIPPNAASGSALALVIVLHGGAGNAASAEKMTGMSQAADRAGFAVAYPDGTGALGDRLLTWNSGSCCGYALDYDVDDVGFVRALIDQLEASSRIDPKRVYVTGISNGGMMAYRVACELSDRVAAIAPVAGALDNPCEPAQPVSVVTFHGTADQNVPYDGGAPTKQVDPHSRVDQSVAYAMSFWTERDGCAAPPDREQSGSIIHEQYAGCSNGTSVVLYTIVGGGHAWPGGDRVSPLLDQPTQEISGRYSLL